jgi:pilus assembly protein Flp/PilA
MYKNLWIMFRNWTKCEEGQGMVEYAMIIGLVAVGVLALLTLMGGQVSDIFTQITNALHNISGVRGGTTTTP